MNTFAFVGDLANHPEVSCVYHSEEAENQFLKGMQSHFELGAVLLPPGTEITLLPADPRKAVLGDGYQNP